MMRSPLIQQLVDEHGYPLVTEASLEALLADHAEVVLFFSENPKAFPESNDVAVVLPELARTFAPRLTVGVVDESAEKSLQKLYGFTTWPALVVLRHGQPLGAITGMQDWSVFTATLADLLENGTPQSSVGRIPVVSEGAPQPH